MILKNKVFIYLLVIFFAVFVGSGLFLLIENKTVPKKTVQNNTDNSLITLKQENLVIPTVVPSQGSLSLVAGTKEARYALTSGAVAVDLVADSNGKNIGGYDIIVEYDPKKLEFVSVVSLLPDFKIYPTNKGNYVAFTAVQSLSSTATILKETRLATLNFRPLKTGKFSLSLRSSTDKFLTDLVTDKTEVLYPALRDILVDVY